MVKRSLSTLILAPPFLAAIWFGFPYFDLLIGVLSVLAMLELLVITSQGDSEIDIYVALLGFCFGSVFFMLSHLYLAIISFCLGWLFAIFSTSRSLTNTGWAGFGYIYIATAAISLSQIREVSDEGRLIIFWFFAIIWGNDIGAYIIGRALGGPRIAPRISPGKTWAGTLGGLVVSGLTSLCFMGTILVTPGVASLVVASLALAIGAQLGDLAESSFKRFYGIKDTGSLIPGHGGVLDRADGVLLTAPIVFVVFVL